jgi:hypothetical protein
MTIHEHVKTFHGLPVTDFDTKKKRPAGPTAWRVFVGTYGADVEFAEQWTSFLDTVDPASVTALVIGPWGQEVFDEAADPVIQAIADAHDRLPALTGIFLGDIIMEEAEISWIHQGDITPLLTAYPRLTELVVRGSEKLKLDPVRHDALQFLRFESGGLPGEVVRAVAGSTLPALRELSLWLGVGDYGATWRQTDLAPILAGSALGALRHLGLQNSDQQDDLARWVAESAIVRQLESLDLSMGTLTDEGAEPLLALTHLVDLDLHHHYLSDEMVERLGEALPGVRLDLSERQQPDRYDDEVSYYTAVAE